jgi:Ca2+-binding RTX toxin-like protein
MLVMERSDNTSPIPVELAQDPGGNDFDGNPDWAPDGRPLCPDSAATTNVNTAVTITVACTDTGPAYEQSEVREFVSTPPTNGTTTQNLAGDPITYTPNNGFTGTDSFQIKSFDELGFGTDTGTVTITVQPAQGGAKPKCAGRTSTIAGTAGKDLLVGTSGNDVIVGLAGNDTIRGGGGRDIICAGSGSDRVSGGRGNDAIRGGSGNDRLRGGSGRDSLNGKAGRDRLNGGPARDRCQGSSGRDRASRCERVSSIP